MFFKSKTRIVPPTICHQQGVESLIFFRKWTSGKWEQVEYLKLNCDSQSCHYELSHTILNVTWIMDLGAPEPEFVLRFVYGYGFKKYGCPDGMALGWDLSINGIEIPLETPDIRRYTFVDTLLLAAYKKSIKLNVEQRDQTLCEVFEKDDVCQPDCKLNHYLFDTKRLEALVRWRDPTSTSLYCEYLALEYAILGGRSSWKITMFDDAFTTLNGEDPASSSIPERPFSEEGQNIFQVVRKVERMIGVNVPQKRKMSFLKSMKLRN